MPAFILAHHHFTNTNEAQASAWTGGSVETRRIDSQAFASLDEAVTSAERRCERDPAMSDLVIYRVDGGAFNPAYTKVANVYWDDANSMASTVTFPMQLAA